MPGVLLELCAPWSRVSQAADGIVFSPSRRESKQSHPPSRLAGYPSSIYLGSVGPCRKSAFVWPPSWERSDRASLGAHELSLLLVQVLAPDPHRRPSSQPSPDYCITRYAPQPTQPRRRALPRTFEAQLQRALRPMLRQVRATLPSIKTAADARALGAALRREWPERVIRELVATLGLKAEARSSRGWAGPKLGGTPPTYGGTPRTSTTEHSSPAGLGPRPRSSRACAMRSLWASARTWSRPWRPVTTRPSSPSAGAAGYR